MQQRLLSTAAWATPPLQSMISVGGALSVTPSVTVHAVASAVGKGTAARLEVRTQPSNAAACGLPSPCGTIAAMLKKVSQGLRDREVVGWSLASAFSTFMIIVIGILTDDPPSSRGFYLVGGIASLVAGGLFGFKILRDKEKEAEKDSRSAEKDRRSEEHQQKLENSLKKLEDALKEVARKESDKLEKEKDEIEKRLSDVHLVLSATGSNLIAIAERNDAHSVFGFISLILERVHEALGESRGPIRVFFLRNCRQPIGPIPADEGFAFSLMGVIRGYCADFKWNIPAASPDAQAASGLLADNPSGQKKRLLVKDADVTQEGWTWYVELAPPDLEPHFRKNDQIRCWYRTPVIAGSARFGILGVDAWRAKAISGVPDENIIDSFATLLAAGLMFSDVIGKATTDGT